jgi:hypothetical protein
MLYLVLSEKRTEMTVQIQNNEILDFVEYVDTFYNPVTGVYPIKGATVEVITKAIKTYIEIGIRRSKLGSVAIASIGSASETSSWLRIQNAR